MTVTTRLLTPAVSHVHVIGIGGKGMSAIAQALLDQGYHVGGTDLSASPYTERLAAHGANIRIGHDAAHIEGAQLVVYSAAVKDDNPERQAATAADIVQASRAEMVAELFNDRRGIAVAGTHGKTTTSAMAATILNEAGYAPSFLIGAAVPSLGDQNGRLTDAPWMVIEADEFDAAFLEYRPDIAVLTHLEPDHLDFFGTEQRMVAAFEAFVDGLGPDTTLLARGDIALLRPVSGRHRGSTEMFGPGEAWDVAAYEPDATGTRLHLRTPAGTVACRTGQHGRHNAWNALAAVAACAHAGVDVDLAARSLEAYAGADRRMQLRARAGGIAVIEDYAHHPTAARATIAAATEIPHDRIWAIYQPLLRSRTRDLFEDFLDAFTEAGRVVLAEIESPPGREGPIDISSADLARSLRHPDVRFLASFDAIAESVTSDLVSGDLVLVMGPESVTPLADRIATWVAGRSGGE